MKSVLLTAYPCSKTRRAGAKQLRSSGRIPAVIYGRQVAPQNLEVVRHELEDLIHNASAENLLLDLAEHVRGPGPVESDSTRAATVPVPSEAFSVFAARAGPTRLG